MHLFASFSFLIFLVTFNESLKSKFIEIKINSSLKWKKKYSDGLISIHSIILILLSHSIHISINYYHITTLLNLIQKFLDLWRNCLAHMKTLSFLWRKILYTHTHSSLELCLNFNSLILFTSTIHKKIKSQNRLTKSILIDQFSYLGVY